MEPSETSSDYVTSHSATSSATSHSAAPDPAASEEIWAAHIEHARVCGQYLVDLGGRPFIPIELLESVARHPEKHKEIMRCWSTRVQGPLQIYTDQARSWLKFRRHQTSARRHYHDSHQGLPKRRRPHDDLEPHVYQAKMVMEKFAITAPPFHFLQEWERQDKLTEWIEYASFEGEDSVLGRHKATDEAYKWHLMDWIGGQIPVIQAEMQQAAAAAAAASTAGVADAAVAAAAAAARVADAAAAAAADAAVVADAALAAAGAAGAAGRCRGCCC